MGDLSNVMGGEFKPSEVPPSEYELLPAGEYPAVIASADLKVCESKSGHMIVLEFSILGGQYDGRKIIERLNIVNASEKAQLISRQQFAKLCDAVGLENVTDTNQVVGKRLKISLDIEKGVGTYINKYGEEKSTPDKNVIKRFLPLNSVAGPVSTPQTEADSSSDAEEIPFETGEPKSRPWA